jgi:hypothetical protein
MSGEMQMKSSFFTLASMLFGATVCMAQQSPQAAPAEAQVPEAGHLAAANSSKMLAFEIVIADLLEGLDSPTAAKIIELEQARRVNFATRLQLTSLEDQTASVQFGEFVSRATGRSVARGFGGGRPGAPPVPIYSSVNVGTTIQITARTEQDGSIVARLVAERSGLNERGETPAGANDSAPPQAVERLATDTTVRLKPGEAQVVGGRQAAAGNNSSRTWILVTARLAEKPSSEAK